MAAEVESEPDALCFAGFILTLFVPLVYVVRATEDEEGWSWEYERIPAWLFLGYALLACAYGECVFWNRPLDSNLHVYLASAAYVAAAKHALRCASSPLPAVANTALMALALALASGAGMRLSGQAVHNCAAVFVGLSLLVGLTTLRLARRWAMEPAYERQEKASRRRAVATLTVCAVAVAAQPYCGACGRVRSETLQAALDAGVFVAATDVLF